MLFLAVFCGFLAEYKLEHMIEHQHGTKKGVLGSDEALKAAGAKLIDCLQNEYHLN